MANFAAQLRDRFFGLVDRGAGCGRPGVKEEAPKSAPAPAVQEVCSHFTRKAGKHNSTVFSTVQYLQSYSCVARELTVPLITLAACRDSTERPRCVRRIGGGSQLDDRKCYSLTFMWLPLF